MIKLNKVFYVCLLSFVLIGCKEKQTEIVQEERLTRDYICEKGYYLTVSDISYSPKISFCCKEVDREKIATAIVNCNKSTLNNVNANTKNQDYHEIPKSCARAIMQAYCTLPTWKTRKELVYVEKRI